MRHGNSIVPGFEGRVAAFSLLAFLGLVLPFVPLPGDRTTHIAVQFQTADMAAPRSFDARTTGNICRVLAVSMAYEDPARGRYTRIQCGRDDAPAMMVGAN